MNIYLNIDNSTRAFIHNALDEKLGILHIKYLKDLLIISYAHIYLTLQMHAKVGYFQYMRVRAYVFTYIKYEYVFAVLNGF